VTSPYTVEVNGRELTTRSIVIATGARPLVPPIPGLDQIDYLTSDNVWNLRELPDRLVVLGGGNIGCELSQAFARFGSRVVQVEMAPRLLAREDPDVSEYVAERFAADGVDVRTDHKPQAVERRDGRNVLICEHYDDTVEFEFDQILIAVGRTPNTQGFGLEELGIEIAANRTLQVNEFLQTRYPSIFACGDVAGPFQFTHTAAHQAWYAAVNALFPGFRRFKADYSVIPWVTFTDPEIGHVGLNETQAREDDVEFEVTRYDLSELDRAIAEGEGRGFIKVLTVPGKDKVLGATIVGENAGELIGEYVTAMRHGLGLGLNKILGTIHAYPTLIEANKATAGEWKRAHAPPRILQWLERFHRWRRSENRRAPDS
jgi:pyruvate/2-oxoglutarate dehydrogenase complex dihydrolipoamide dehydrogenase (E3) component